MKPTATKTNVMRLLEQAGIPYETITYEYDEDNLSGLLAAQECGIDPDTMFKTLVTRGEKCGIIVFCIPVSEELDLKKCAAAAGDKRIEMTHVKELQGLTGYIRGGCSPIGMKKNYPVYLEESAVLFDRISVSGGARGIQVRLSPDDLVRYTGAKLCEIVK